MYNSLLKKIIEYDKITILRHIRPDGDAMFSAMAVYQFIRDNFPEKTVKVGGYDEYDVYTKKDKISNKFLSESLCIAVDTSTSDRIDEPRYYLSPFLIKIDHHPIIENYGDINIVDPTVAACCQLIAEIFFSKTFSKYLISPDTCKYLYCGIVTDTNNFSTTNTSARTLEIAAKIAAKGDLKISGLLEYLLDKDIDTFRKITKIRDNLQIREKFGYICLDQQKLADIEMAANQAKNNIDEIGRIADLNIWAFACEEPDGSYSISLRSKRGYVVNTLAAKYKGGGHANASGIKGLQKKQLDTLLDELVEMSTKHVKSAKKPLK